MRPVVEFGHQHRATAYLRGVKIIRAYLDYALGDKGGDLVFRRGVAD
jgi:hypothetical protein